MPFELEKNSVNPQWIYEKFKLLGLFPTDDQNKLDEAWNNIANQEHSQENFQIYVQTYEILSEQIKKGFDFLDIFTLNEEFQQYYPKNSVLFAVEMNHFAIQVPKEAGNGTYLFKINAYQVDVEFLNDPSYVACRCHFVGYYPQVDYLFAYGISACVALHIETSANIKALGHIECNFDLGFTMLAIAQFIQAFAHENDLGVQTGNFKLYGSTPSSWEILMRNSHFDHQPAQISRDLISRLQCDEDDPGEQDDPNDEFDENIITVFFDNPKAGMVKIIDGNFDDITDRITNSKLKRSRSQDFSSFYREPKKQKTDGDDLLEEYKPRST